MAADATTERAALVVGATGIAGSAVAEQLLEDGWAVYGLCRKPDHLDPRITPVVADLLDPNSLTTALADIRPTHVFYTSWARMPTEAENCVVNGAMVRDLFDALTAGGSVQHAALLTGLKHYMGPFEAYGTGEMADTPFTEEAGRQDVANFYYDQEDAMFAAAERDNFTWSVHRAHTISGHALGNVMNFALTVAVQAAICKELGQPLIFNGSDTQWNGLTDVSDSTIVAKQMIWASTTPGIGNEAWNVANGEVFRWRVLWPKLAQYLGVDWEGFVDKPRTAVEQMTGKQDVWQRIVEREGLVEPRLDRVAAFWHSDSDLGLETEVITGMTKSRLAGFTEYVSTEAAFKRLFDRYREENIIPKFQ